jgi:ATP:corrinoid adenosyltransferase
MADKGKFTPIAVAKKRWPSGIKDIANISGSLAEATYPGNEQWQGRGDAFRHIVWQALMAKQYGETAAKAAGFYHELPLGAAFKAADTDQSDEEKQQDLYNNKLGIDIASKSKTVEDIYNFAKEAVDSGKAKYLSLDDLEYKAALRSLEDDKAFTQY